MMLLAFTAAFAFADPHFAGKAARQFGELGRGAGVQAQVIADGRRATMVSSDSFR
jgi:hypothetical protein